MPRPLFILPGLTLLCQAISAQDSVADSTYAKAAYNNAVTSYYKYTDKQARLYNGFLHIGYSHKIEGNAYYLDNTWKTGTVVYDGLSFPGTNMMYDIYKDELVIQHFHRLMLTLHNEKIKEFSWEGHRFIRHVRDSVEKGSPATGFYEELYNGKTNLLARRQKLLEEIVTDVLEQKFISKNFYYIKRDNAWYAVKTLKELRAILKEKSKEIRQHLRKNKIKYRKERERALILAVQHFDELTQ
jgi:hypothetical protein